jgi:hypothetical protein
MVDLQPWTGVLSDDVTEVTYPSYGCTVQECKDLGLYQIADREDRIVYMGDAEMLVQRRDKRWHFLDLKTDERFCVREIIY